MGGGGACPTPPPNLVKARCTSTPENLATLTKHGKTFCSTILNKVLLTIDCKLFFLIKRVQSVQITLLRHGVAERYNICSVHLCTRERTSEITVRYKNIAIVNE